MGRSRQGQAERKAGPGHMSLLGSVNGVLWVPRQRQEWPIQPKEWVSVSPM